MDVIGRDENIINMLLCSRNVLCEGLEQLSLRPLSQERRPGGIERVEIAILFWLNLGCALLPNRNCL